MDGHSHVTYGYSPASEKQGPGISMALTSLEVELAEIEKAAAEVCARLEPVMQLDTPTLAKQGGAPARMDVSMKSSVHARIQSAGDKVADVRVMLTRILQRLEV